jgi:hypothetical protein
MAAAIQGQLGMVQGAQAHPGAAAIIAAGKAPAIDHAATAIQVQRQADGTGAHGDDGTGRAAMRTQQVATPSLTISSTPKAGACARKSADHCATFSPAMPMPTASVSSAGRCSRRWQRRRRWSGR